MNLGLAIADFRWPGGAVAMSDALRDISRAAEDAGFTRIAVMDHLWQVGSPAVADQEMLEGYTTLGFLAACTSRVELLTLVTAAIYREPGLLAKIVTTLDVLSGGRVVLGIGAGAPFGKGEADGLGLPFPPLAERLERLEEALQICLQMWSASEAPYVGRHYRLGRTLNSPQPLRRPHPPILIGGAGERKTLRLVAQYADACNLFDSPELPHKLRVLREHCDVVGRDYDDIQKTVVSHMDPGDNGERAALILRHLEHLEALGIDHVIGTVRGCERLRPLEAIGRDVIPYLGQRTEPEKEVQQA
jgi:F420-dependent oxidoreductase-like protein